MTKPSWISVLFTLLLLWLAAVFLSGFVGIATGDETSFDDGNVAIIPVKGIIVGDESTGLFDDTVASEEIVKLIRKADKNSRIKAIVLEINSPGGSPVASDEIGQALKQTNKTTVGWIREVGASGGYWIASATDYVVANRMSITGSIGVVASYLEVSGLLDRYNVTYQRMISGKYKDLGSPYKSLTNEERLLFQEKLDDLHSFFIQEVAENRDLETEVVSDLATGLFYLGSEAYEAGLVDELGGREQVLAYVERQEGIDADAVTYESTGGLFELFSSRLGFAIGQGIGWMFLHKASQEQFEITM